MMTPRMKRGSLRSRLSASVFNRTVDSLQRTNRLSTGWGGPSSTARVYQNLSALILRKQAAVSCSGGLWVTDPETEWQVAGLRPDQIAEAYRLASVYRVDYPSYSDLTGSDLLYAAAANPYGCVGSSPWVWGDQTAYENPAATPITSSPDTWYYPGGFCGSTPWAGNPNDAGSADHPGWALSDGTEQWAYSFYPLVNPSFTTNIVQGGPEILLGEAQYNTAGIIDAMAVPLGLPEFIRQCPKGTVIHEALQEVGCGTATWSITTAEAENATDPATITVAATSTGEFNLVLLGEKRVGSTLRWDPLAGGVSGTGVSGHSTVVDVTGLLMQLLNLSGKGSAANSAYAHFALIPATVASLVGVTDGRALLRGLAPMPVMEWDPVAEEWFIAYAQQRILNYDNPTIGQVALTFSYPYGEVQRCVIPDFWPICTSEAG